MPNISRFCNNSKPGIFYPLMIHAIEVFKREFKPVTAFPSTPMPGKNRQGGPESFHLTVF